METITTTDGTEVFYEDGGSGQPVVFSHGSTPRRASPTRRFVFGVLRLDGKPHPARSAPSLYSAAGVSVPGERRKMTKRLGISVVLSLVALLVLTGSASGAADGPKIRKASLPLDPIGLTLTNDYIGELQPRGVVKTATRCRTGRKLNLLFEAEVVATVKSTEGGDYIFDPGVSAEEARELQTFTIDLKPKDIGPRRDPRIRCKGATKRLVADGVFNSVTINLNAGTSRHL